MKGADFIKDFCKNLPEKPGIYKMLDANGQILYIGKAKNLKKRVIYYTKPEDLITRLARMVFLVASAEYILTSSEAEAFLLEAREIKQHQPRFNILLKDDKSFPYIKINFTHEFPQIMKYRGKKLDGESYFGPFASSQDVDRTINIIKKVFKIRGCSDNYFASRKRPCLQYQIKRCSAPCVLKISKEDYKEQINNSVKFLKGQSSDLHKSLSAKMQEYSENLEYEKAAEVRGGIKALSYVQINASLTSSAEDVDVIAIETSNGFWCVEIFFYRAGQSFGSSAYFPIHSDGAEAREVLSTFIGQFYQIKMPAKNIVCNIELEFSDYIIEALFNLHKVKCKIIVPKSGAFKTLLAHAMLNCSESLKREASIRIKNTDTLESIARIFGIEEEIKRIEVYDNSHIMGKFAVGAMVVAGPEGFLKNEYRKFTIDSEIGVRGGDDYDMMKMVLRRRIKKFTTHPEKIPSLIILDGGKGHLSAALEVFREEGVCVTLVCMSKGEKRNGGCENFHMENREVFTLDNHSKEMKYLQILRDEVHNFAITSHRRKRTKAIYQSQIDAIDGVGPKRKKALLNYFGSFDAIKNASMEDLRKVEGISRAIAVKIRDYTIS